MGRSIGRASDSRPKDPRFECRQEHKKNVTSFPSQKCCADSLSVCPMPVRIRMHKNDHVRTYVKDPVVHVRVRWIPKTRKDLACTCIYRTGHSCYCGCCSLSQVRRPEFPERDNKVYYYILKNPHITHSQESCSVPWQVPVQTGNAYRKDHRDQHALDPPGAQVAAGLSEGPGLRDPRHRQVAPRLLPLGPHANAPGVRSLLRLLQRGAGLLHAQK